MSLYDLETASNGVITLTPESSPVPPPAQGQPALSVGNQTIAGFTFVPKTTVTNFTSRPSGFYVYDRSPGPGDNQEWDGTGTSFDPVTGDMIFTTSMKGTVVNNGGAGFSGPCQVTAPYMADWTMFLDPNGPAGLVRYGLFMGAKWPLNQEDDNLEGSQGNFNIHLHTAQGTLNGTPWTEPTGVWVCFRAYAIPSMGLALLSGPDFSDLSMKGQITAAQIAAIGASIDTTPHDFDIAQEAEGPISSIPTPIVDKVGGVGLYSAA